jgi:serine phosphatase RsbU (regulator of sigma subunit)/FixJ family two-component response regulator
MKEPLYIVCVDDEKMILDNLEAQISRHMSEPYRLEIAESGAEALELLKDLQDQKAHLALLISDQIMPGMTGDQLLIEAHRRFPDTPKILLTGQAGLDAVQNVVNQARLFRYLSKPWDETDLIVSVREATRQYFEQLKIRRQNVILSKLNQASQDFARLVKTEELMRRIVEVSLEISGADLGFFILGGSSKAIEKPWLQVALRTAGRNKTEDIEELLSDPENAASTLLDEKRSRDRPADTRQLVAVGPPNDLRGFLIVETETPGKALDVMHYEALLMLAASLHLQLKRSELYLQLLDANRDITDSLVYARRIQEAMMPPPELLNHFRKQLMVTYRPKSIVSGDFYWWNVTDDNTLLLAVGDCTGHGAPGAMMSALAFNMLQQVINDYQLTEPNAILIFLDHKMQSVFSATEEDSDSHAIQEHGMDIGLLHLDPKAQLLWFAGARRPLYHLRGDELTIKEGTRRSIGDSGTGEEQSDRLFEMHCIRVESGDRVFMFSDGLTDQFGGPDNSRFSKRRLRNLLEYSHREPLTRQHEMVVEQFDKWIGTQELTDDVLFVSLEI